MVEVNAKRLVSIESGLNTLKGILELIDFEYVPHFEKLNKGFNLHLGDGRTINYNVGYPSFVWYRGHRFNVETIAETLESAKVEPHKWQREFVDCYGDINIAMVETDLMKLLLDKISEYELEISLLEQELAEE